MFNNIIEEITYKLSVKHSKLIDTDILGKERSIRDNGLLNFKKEDKISELEREMEFKLKENKKIKKSLQLINEGLIIDKYTKLIEKERKIQKYFENLNNN